MIIYFLCLWPEFSNFSGQNIYSQNPLAPSPQNQMVVRLWHIVNFFRKQLDGRGEGEDRPEVNSLFQRGTNTNILFIQIKGPLEDIIQEIYGSAIGFSLFRSFGPYNIFLVTDRSIYCHMTLSAMNYLLYICQFCFPLVTTLLNIIIAVVKPYQLPLIL